MKDYTAEVAELNAAYVANKVAAAQITAEVRAKYAARIKEEIASRKAEADLQFARHLADVKNRSGMPLTVIQDEVLHTRSWARWVYWRDLAEIEPERVVVRNAKAEREAAENAPFVWDFENRTLTVRIDRKGVRLSNPWVLTDFTYDRYGGMYRYKGDADRFEGLRISDEIERAVNAGEIEVEEGVYS